MCLKETILSHAFVQVYLFTHSKKYYWAPIYAKECLSTREMAVHKRDHVPVTVHPNSNG